MEFPLLFTNKKLEPLTSIKYMNISNRLLKTFLISNFQCAYKYFIKIQQRVKEGLELQLIATLNVTFCWNVYFFQNHTVNASSECGLNSAILQIKQIDQVS